MHFWNYDGKQTFLKFSPFGVWFLNWSYHAAGPVYWPNVWPPGDEEEHFPECNSPPKCSAEREAGAGWSNDRVGDSGWDCNVWTIILHYNLQLPTVVLIFYFYFVVQYVYCLLFLKWSWNSLQQKNINTSLEILEAEREQVALESEHMLSEIGNTEHQALTKGTGLSKLKCQTYQVL